jgi:hypothetical protein
VGFVVNAGDICTHQNMNGKWAFFWILRIDEAPRIPERIFSLRKFDATTEDEVRAEDVKDVEELKTLQLLGHFPIVESRVLEVEPRVIGAMPVTDDVLEGYQLWREAFDDNKGGVFTVPLSEL